MTMKKQLHLRVTTIVVSCCQLEGLKPAAKPNAIEVIECNNLCFASNRTEVGTLECWQNSKELDGRQISFLSKATSQAHSVFMGNVLLRWRAYSVMMESAASNVECRTR